MAQNPIETIADALDALAVAVMRACQDLEFPPTGRLVLKAQTGDEWHQVFYFGSESAHIGAIKNGDAYRIQRLYHANMHQVPDAGPVNVHFHASYPAETPGWIKSVAERCEADTAGAQAHAGQSMQGTCHRCGHDVDTHQLMGWPDPESGKIMEGWMVCGEPSCACFGTWSIGAPK